MNATTNAGERRFCTFYLGEECYGIDILTVREINAPELREAKPDPPEAEAA